MTDVIVVGGGIAGCAAVLRAAQNGMTVAWVFGDKASRKRSRAQWVPNIDNMIGLHDGIVRAGLASALRGPEHAATREALEAVHHVHISAREIIANTRERIVGHHGHQVHILDETATSAAREGDGFVVHTDSGQVRGAACVLATGVMDRQPRIKGERRGEVLDDPTWIYPFANRESVLYCVRCEGHLTAGTPTAIIGYSEAAAQVGLMLYERFGSTSAILLNGDEPGWSERTDALLGHYGIVVHPERIVGLGGKKGELHTVNLEGGAELTLRYALVVLGLARLDASDLRLQLQQAQAAVAQADANAQLAARNLERVEQLYVSDNASAADVDAARANHESARAGRVSAIRQRDLARRGLDAATLTATRDGVVAQVIAKANENVGAGTPVLVLTPDEELEVTVAVSAAWVERLRTGARAEVRFPELGDSARPARVTEVGGTSQSAGSFPVTVELLERDPALRPGLVAEVTLSLPASDERRIELPLSAVAEDGEGRYVWRVVGDGEPTVERVEVQTGELTGDGIVKTGIAAGERVVTAGISKLHAGRRVRVEAR